MSSAWAQVFPPSIDQQFVPGSIPSGDVSTLRITISNWQSGSADLENANFTSTLPTNVVVASPLNARSGCQLGENPTADSNNGREDGTVSATSGGSEISFDIGLLPGGFSCAIEVDVTSSVVNDDPGYINPEITLNYTIDSVGGAVVSEEATLLVTDQGPLFSKSFNPAVVVFGGRTRLSFVIDNSQGGDLRAMNFSDDLPVGMTIADPSDISLSDNCLDNPVLYTLTATPGSSTLSYLANSNVGLPPVLPAGLSCTIEVDVVGGAVGNLLNVSEELISSPSAFGSDFVSAPARATLEVIGGQIEHVQSFTDDPVVPGGTVNLEYTVQNTDRVYPATGITFSNDLGANLTVASVPIEPCGAGSTINILNPSSFALVDGTLGAEASCTFTIELTVDANTGPAAYPNATSEISATINTVAVSNGPATDTLFVRVFPLLTKTFLADSVVAGGDIGLEFTVTNTSANAAATDIAFTDQLTDILPYPLIVTEPTDPCGAGSTFAVIGVTTDTQALSLTDGTLAAGAFCSFTTTITVPSDVPVGNYTNTTSSITATVGGNFVAGAPASDSFAVIGAPTFTKQFTDDPVKAGDTVTLEFTLTHNDSAPTDATSIEFTDNLNDVIDGLTAFGLPASDVCGTGSELTGTSTLALSNGTLAQGESCTFSATLDVPAGTDTGLYINETSMVMAIVDGQSLVGNSATDDLIVGGLVLSKAFDPATTLAGTSVDVTYTVSNLSTQQATGVLFTDNLGSLIPGLVIGGVPQNDICGAGSSLTESGGLLTFNGGILDGETDCTFSATINIPSGTDDDIYSGATSAIDGTIGGVAVSGAPASADLEITSNVIAFSKEFLDDFVRPGDSVMLRFTIENLLSDQAVTDIEFTDDLDSALSGLTVTSAPANACDGTVTIGNDVEVQFAGGVLTAAASCSFDVEVTVAEDTPPGSVAYNETSEINGNVMGLPVSGDPATDELQVAIIQLSKDFIGEDEAFAGGTVQLAFTLTNVSASEPLFDLSFNDDLDAFISGATAIGLPLDDVCGAGSQIDGTSVVILQNASLLPAGSCTVTIQIQIPAGTPLGFYTNTTSEVRWRGVASADAASAELEIIESPDSDNDGVLDSEDMCLDTQIPESVPTIVLKPNNYALVDEDTTFDIGTSKGKGSGKNRSVYTTVDTAGCSCEQIIEALDLGNGHTKFGCSPGAMSDWIDIVNMNQ